MVQKISKIREYNNHRRVQWINKQKIIDDLRKRYTEEQSKIDTEKRYLAMLLKHKLKPKQTYRRDMHKAMAVLKEYGNKQ